MRCPTFEMAFSTWERRCSEVPHRCPNASITPRHGSPLITPFSPLSITVSPCDDETERGSSAGYTGVLRELYVEYRRRYPNDLVGLRVLFGDEALQTAKEQVEALESRLDVLEGMDEVAKEGVEAIDRRLNALDGLDDARTNRMYETDPPSDDFSDGHRSTSSLEEELEYREKYGYHWRSMR